MEDIHSVNSLDFQAEMPNTKIVENEGFGKEKQEEEEEKEKDQEEEKG